MCWTCTFDGGVANAVVGRGDIPAIDWANDASAAMPTSPPAIRQQAHSLAQAMKAFGHPMFLLFDEEMNGTWYSVLAGPERQHGRELRRDVAARPRRLRLGRRHERDLGLVPEHRRSATAALTPSTSSTRATPTSTGPA